MDSWAREIKHKTEAEMDQATVHYYSNFEMGDYFELQNMHTDYSNSSETSIEMGQYGITNSTIQQNWSATLNVVKPHR